MKTLSDEAVERLRAAVRAPDLTGTRYRLIRLLGSGGMGAVYEAEDSALDRRVALKVLELPDSSGDLSARLVREARVLGRLEHPGIVPVHDVGTLPDGRVFYAMKRVEGDRLDERLAGVPSRGEKLRMFLRIAETVAFAHAHGILHRDLKPENVMVGPFGEVLVMDWGLARALAAETGEEREAPLADAPARPGTAAGAVLGTPGYMSPEQLAGAPLDARADVYALGALLRFVLGAPAGKDAAPALPRPLAAICARALAPGAADRYRDVPALVADVAAFLEGGPVSADPEGPVRRLLRVLRRHRVAVILVLAYVVTRALVLLVTRR